MRFPFLVLPVFVVAMLSLACLADERHETFDRDPAWDGHNNRARGPKPQRVRQDFGRPPPSLPITQNRLRVQRSTIDSRRAARSHALDASSTCW